MRFFANLSRSINEIIWALLFVSAVGLGPMPGILALGIHTSGVLIKLFSEGIETAQQEPIDALTATGAGFVKVICYAVIPQITPFFVSMSLYRLESDVRSATILGFTGAGGIGVYLFDKLRSYENHDVTTILIIIVITVADHRSDQCRHQDPVHLKIDENGHQPCEWMDIMREATEADLPAILRLYRQLGEDDGTSAAIWRRPGGSSAPDADLSRLPPPCRRRRMSGSSAPSPC